MRGFKLVAVVSALSMAAFTIAIGAARPWSPSSTAPAGSAPTTTQQRAVDDYAKLPVSFVENRGQAVRRSDNDFRQRQMPRDPTGRNNGKRLETKH